MSHNFKLIKKKTQKTFELASFSNAHFNKHFFFGASFSKLWGDGGCYLNCLFSDGGDGVKNLC